MFGIAKILGGGFFWFVFFDTKENEHHISFFQKLKKASEGMNPSEAFFKFLLFPGMIDVLHIFVIFQHINEFIHIFDLVFVR